MKITVLQKISTICITQLFCIQNKTTSKKKFFLIVSDTIINKISRENDNCQKIISNIPIYHHRSRFTNRIHQLTSFPNLQMSALTSAARGNVQTSHTPLLYYTPISTSTAERFLSLSQQIDFPSRADFSLPPLATACLALHSTLKRGYAVAGR